MTSLKKNETNGLKITLLVGECKQKMYVQR